MRALPMENDIGSKKAAYELLKDLKTARQHFNLEIIDIVYLENAISKIRVDDLIVGVLCGFWDKASNLVSEWDIRPRRLRDCEKRMHERGFIRRTFFKNGHRSGNRGNNGITSLVGIDLAPLFNRADEIEAAARAVRVSNDQRDELRTEIRDTIRNIRCLDPEAIEAMYEVDKRLRPIEIENIERLKEILTGLLAVYEEFSSSSGRKSGTPSAEVSTRPITPPYYSINTSMLTPEIGMCIADDELKATIKIYCRHDPSWNGFINGVREHAIANGLSAHVWHQRSNAMNAKHAAFCWIIADRNAKRAINDKYRIRDACGAFVKMAKKEAHKSGVMLSLLGELVGYQMKLETRK